MEALEVLCDIGLSSSLGSVFTACASSFLVVRQGHFKACQVLGPLYLPSNKLLLSVLEVRILFPLMTDLFRRSGRAAVSYYMAPYSLPV